MNATPLAEVQAPRFETGRAMIIAGLNVRYTHETRVNIPRQWDRFAPYIGKVPGQVGLVSYGVCWNFDAKGDFDYLSGVEVRSVMGLDDNFTSVEIEVHKYAVFTHSEHVSRIPNTIQSIWGKWLPSSGHKMAHAPAFERYDENFDPHIGMGGMEIWVPIVES